MRTRLGWTLVVVLLALPLGVLAVLRFGTSGSIDAASNDVQPLLTAPTVRRVTDEKRVAARVTLADGLALRAPTWRGTVGTLRPGEALRSGDAVAVIDGVRRVALATPDPLYRALAAGDSGPDVEQLNRALLALGYLKAAPANIDQYLFPTVLAVRAWASELGLRQPDGSFDPGWVVWLPKDPFPLGEWSLEAGAPAPAAGTIIAREPVRVTAAALVSQNPAEPLVLDPAVAWTFVSGEVALPVDAAALAIAPASAAALSALVKAGRDQVDGIVRRAQPLDALAVPSTAVQVGADGALCVWLSDGAGYRAAPVRVAGARAGVTNVVSGLSAGDSVLANPAAVLEDPSCPSP